MSNNWVDLNSQIIKAFDLENKPVVSIDISFGAGRVPTAKVILDLGMNETGDDVIRQLCHYELVERKPNEQVD